VGQVVVSREGDVWRWDGIVASAEAPTAAALRLAQRNRLSELSGEIESAQVRLTNAEADLSAREAVRSAQKSLAETRDDLARAERARGEIDTRRAGLTETETRLTETLNEVSS